MPTSKFWIRSLKNRTLACLSTAALLAWLVTPSLHAQDTVDGEWQVYDAEWHHVSAQLIALAEATPEKNFAWRPAPGVRSTSEVYMHIVDPNFYLLSVTGVKMPADLTDDAEKKATSKADVIRWLRRSLEAVKQAQLKQSPEQLARKLKIEGRELMPILVSA
jgi:hypothetical protein